MTSSLRLSFVPGSVPGSVRVCFLCFCVLAKFSGLSWQWQFLVPLCSGFCVFFMSLLFVVYDRLFLFLAQFFSVLYLRVELRVTVPSRGTLPCVFYGWSECFLDFRLLSLVTLRHHRRVQSCACCLRQPMEMARSWFLVAQLWLVGDALQHPLALLRRGLPGLALCGCVRVSCAFSTHFALLVHRSGAIVRPLAHVRHFVGFLLSVAVGRAIGVSSWRHFAESFVVLLCTSFRWILLKFRVF